MKQTTHVLHCMKMCIGISPENIVSHLLYLFSIYESSFCNITLLFTCTNIRECTLQLVNDFLNTTFSAAAIHTVFIIEIFPTYNVYVTTPNTCEKGTKSFKMAILSSMF